MPLVVVVAIYLRLPTASSEHSAGFGHIWSLQYTPLLFYSNYSESSFFIHAASCYICRFHTIHTWVQNNSNSSKVRCSMNSSIKCNISDYPCLPFCSFRVLPAQKSWATTQSHSAWIVDFVSLVQIEHLSSLITLLLVKFTTIGRISWQALHANTLILFRSQSFHIAAYTFFAAQPLDVPTQFSSIKSLLATW